MEQNIYEEVYFMKQTFQCVSYDEDSFVMDWSMLPGGSVPTHYHASMDEEFVVVAGEAEFVIDGKRVVARTGDTIFVPKTVPHSIRTVSTDDLECRVQYSPCSDTHKMFAIFGGLKRDGVTGMKYLIKAEYLCRQAGLAEFSTAPRALDAITKGIMGLLTPVARLRKWERLSEKYLAD